jgi:hypothetical protein
MATRQYVTDVANAATALGQAVQRLWDSFNRVIPNEPIGSIRADLKAAEKAVDDLRAHIQILEQHIKGKPKIVRLLKDKYKNAARVLDDSKTELQNLTGSVTYVAEQVRQIYWA